MGKEDIDDYKNSLPPLDKYIPGLDKIIAGNEAHGRCPFCHELGDPLSPCFWVWIDSQRYQCRKCGENGDIIDYIAKIERRSLNEQLNDAGLGKDNEVDPVRKHKPAPPDQEVAILPVEAKLESKKKDAETLKKEKLFDYIWSCCLEKEEAYSLYLGPSRGINITERSPAIRWNSYKGDVSCVMALTKPGDLLSAPQSVLKIFLKKDEAGNFDKDKGRKPEARNRYNGAQSGRAVWFFPDKDKKVVGHGEGQETLLAVFAASGMNVAASLTTSGINNVEFFPEQETVYFFIDEDEPKWNTVSGKQIGCQGQTRGLKAAFRAEKKGLKVLVVTPTSNTFSAGGYASIKKTDFNDLLNVDVSGQSIRDRIAAAVPPSEIEWIPPADKEVSGSLIDEDTGKLVMQSKAAALLGDRLSGRFASSCIGSWYQFGGASWGKCEKGELKKEVVSILDQEAGAIGYNASYLAGSLSLLQDSGRIALSDEPKNKIGFLNGILDLKTMDFTKTTPENALQWHLPHVYKKEADCPFFISWLDSACEDPTGDTQWLIRGMFNAALVERGDLQFFGHLKGLPGTGKGTCTRILEAVVGASNYTSSSFEALAKDKFETRKYYKKRLIVFNDVPKHLEIQKFLQLTGRDSLPYNLKHSNVDLSYIYLGLVIMNGNEFVTTNDQTSSAIERRRLTIIFDKVFSSAEREAWDNKGGTEELIIPEVPGIINWALGMTREEVTDVFHNPPEKVVNANRRAERINSPLVPFVEKNVRYSDGSFIHLGTGKTRNEDGEKIFIGEADKLYPRYLGWCDGEKNKPLSRARFKEAFSVTANRILGGEGKSKIYKVEGSENKVCGGYPFINVELVPLYAIQEHHSESIKEFLPNADDIDSF